MIDCAFFKIQLKRRVKKLRQVVRPPKARQRLSRRKRCNTQRTVMRKYYVELEDQLNHHEDELKTRFQELGLMAQFLVDADNSAQQAQHSYNEILSSTSLRVTAPLRWFKELLRH